MFSTRPPSSFLSQGACLRGISTLRQVLPIFHTPSLSSSSSSSSSSSIPSAAKAHRILSKLKPFPGFHFEEGKTATPEHLLSAHCPRYVESLLSGKTSLSSKTEPCKSGKEGIEQTLQEIGCTLSALESLMKEEYSIAASLHGGFHHAFSDRGYSGHVFNDLAIAAAIAISEYSLQKVLILDLDVEFGDGTAQIFENAPSVFTLSVHSSQTKADVFGCGSFDVECNPSTTDAQYSHLLRRILPRVLREQHPDLLIFQAGVGALEWDARGLMRLSRKGLRDRNSLVFGEALEQKIPVLVVCGSGMGAPENPFAQRQVLEAHADTYRNALQTIVQRNHRLFYF